MNIHLLTVYVAPRRPLVCALRAKCLFLERRWRTYHKVRATDKSFSSVPCQLVTTPHHHSHSPQRNRDRGEKTTTTTTQHIQSIRKFVARRHRPVCYTRCFPHILAEGAAARYTKVHIGQPSSFGQDPRSCLEKVSRIRGRIVYVYSS